MADTEYCCTYLEKELKILTPYEQELLDAAREAARKHVEHIDAMMRKYFYKEKD